jgi:hypothetical protein
MADDTTQTGAADGATTTTILGDGQQQAQFTPSYEGALKSDGTFAEGWHAKALGADYNGPLAQVKSVADVDKMLRDNIAAARAKTDGMVKIPGADAKPEELAAYRKAIGAPEKPEDYGELRPDKIPVEAWDAASDAKLKAVAHKHGLPPAALKDILGIYAEQIDTQMTKGMADMTAHVEGQKAILKQEWGEKFEGNVRQTIRFAATLGLKPDHPVFQNADVVRALQRGASLVSEDKLINGSTIGLAASPGEQAKAIMTNPANPHYKAYQSGDPNAVALVNNLLQQS